MTETDWNETPEWREKPPTEKQYRMFHGIMSNAISEMNRGELSDFIQKILGKSNYHALKEDLKKKNRSWKWKEDLK